MTVDSILPSPARPNPFSANDVITILRERSWLSGEPSATQLAWCERAAMLLGPQAADLPALADLLSLIFRYDAREILASTDAHVVLSRYAARDVLRELALPLLSGGPLTPERFQEIVTTLKEKLEVRGRELFHPLRLALAGHSGEGELDRVILLLDEGEAAHFGHPVKSARSRIAEFCAALD